MSLKIFLRKRAWMRKVSLLIAIAAMTVAAAIVTLSTPGRCAVQHGHASTVVATDRHTVSTTPSAESAPGGDVVRANPWGGNGWPGNHWYGGGWRGR